MENQTPVLAKKLMHMAGVLLIVLRKGKRKLLLDLNIALKRGKVAGKSIFRELVFDHHNRRRSKAELCNFEGEMEAALEKIYGDAAGVISSPALPDFGFGRSPAVRQLRVTDSPFPMSGGGGDSRVDEKAEEFIKRFYSQLQREPSRDW